MLLVRCSYCHGTGKRVCACRGERSVGQLDRDGCLADTEKPSQNASEAEGRSEDCPPEINCSECEGTGFVVCPGCCGSGFVEMPALA